MTEPFYTQLVGGLDATSTIPYHQYTSNGQMAPPTKTNLNKTAAERVNEDFCMATHE